MRCLVVDDEDLARQRLARLLDDAEGYEVCGEAASGEQALQQTQQLQPELVLMDIRMPEVDGIETTKQIKKLKPKTEIIVLSYTDHYADEALAAGADKFVLKQGNSLPLIKEIIRSCGSKKPAA